MDVRSNSTKIARTLRARLGQVGVICLLNLSVPGIGMAAPVNDNFTNRIALMGSIVSAAGDNTYATREPDEPTQGSGSIWWSWIAPTSGTFTVTAKVHNFTPYLFVYTGSDLRNLTLTGSDRSDPFAVFEDTAQVVVQAVEGTSYSLAVSVYSGGDGAVNLSIVQGSPPSVIILTPTNEAKLYATESILLRADAADADGRIAKVEFVAIWQGAILPLGTVTNAPFEGRFNFNYNFADGGPQSALIQARATDDTGTMAVSPKVQLWVTFPPPPNDDFTNRLSVVGSFITVTGNNLYALREPADPTPGRGSLWWAWTAPTSGVYRITAVALGGFFVPFVGVYTGSTLSNLSPVGTATGSMSDDSYSARVTLDAVGGSTYSIAISAAAIYAGDLRLCISPSSAPDTAEFEDIIAEPSAQGFRDGVVSLHLWFRTGSGSRWRVEASTNFVTWEVISQEFLPNCRLDLTTSNTRTRWVEPYYYEWYVLPRLFFRLAPVPSHP